MPTCDKCRLGTLCIHYGPGKDAWEQGRKDAWNSDVYKRFIEENTRLRAYASVFWPLIIELKDSAEYVSGDFLSDLADEYVARLKEERGEYCGHSRGRNPPLDDLDNLCPHCGATKGVCGDAGHHERSLPLHRTEAGWPRCATCDGGGCPDCTDPA